MRSMIAPSQDYCSLCLLPYAAIGPSGERTGSLRDELQLDAVGIMDHDAAAFGRVSCGVLPKAVSQTFELVAV